MVTHARIYFQRTSRPAVGMRTRTSTRLALAAARSPAVSALALLGRARAHIQYITAVRADPELIRDRTAAPGSHTQTEK